MGSKGKQPAARLGDIDTGHPPAPPTPIITASGNVFINGIPAARKGDMLAPHHPGVRIITEGSVSVKINGMPAARITDAINCGGKIVVGSGNVLIGDSPPSGSPLAPGEWDDYIAASSTAQNPSPVQDQQMRADSAVKYRGKAAAATSWKSYYSDMSPKDRPAPSSVQNPAQRSGLEQANSTPPSPVPTLPGPTQQQTIDSAGQQMVQAIKNLAEGEMVTPEMLSLASTMLQAGGQSTKTNQPVSINFPKQFKSIYEQAPAAKLEIDSMADEIAEMFGGQVSKAPVKSQERAIQKIMNDYGGDASRIKDLARNTIIVSPDKMDAVVAELSKRGANVKLINGTTDPLGYSGANSTMKTRSGIFGEVQVNTPAMIYAKEPESLARVLLGDGLYNSIASKSGIAGGQGHKLYEQWRVLPAADPARITIEAQSRTYYNAVRSSIYGN